MKSRKFIFILTIVLFSFALFGCQTSLINPKNKNKLYIVTSSFPSYDFVREIGGELVDVEMLVPAGLSGHSYEPTIRDIKKMQTADLFIYNGPNSEPWAEHLIESTDREDLLILRMTDCVDLIKKPNSKYDDEHVWTTPINAALIAECIAETLIELDPSNGGAYQRGLRKFTEQMDILDQHIREAVSNALRDKIIFSGEFPFLYFTTEYGIKYDSVYEGCSDHGEPSPQTLSKIMETINKEKIKYVFYLEFEKPNIVKMISNYTQTEGLLFHSFHNVSKKELGNGITYIELMIENINNLIIALNN